MHLDPLTNIQISHDRQRDAQRGAARANLVRAARASKPRTSFLTRLLGRLDRAAQPESATRTQQQPQLTIRDTH